MILVSRFCAKCGKKIDKFYGIKEFLCLNCYYNKYPLFNLNNEYLIKICPNCSSYAFDDENWNFDNIKSQNIVELIGKAFFNSTLRQIQEKNNVNFELNFDLDSFKNSNEEYIELEVSGNVIEREKNQRIRIDIKHPICEICAKIIGKRFESIIQLRNHPNKKINLINIIGEIKDFVNEQKKLNPDLYVSEIKKTKNGFNLYVSNKTIMKMISSYIDKKYTVITKTSNTLIGRNQETGGDLYRITLLIRFIPIVVGTRILFKNKKYIIKKISNKVVQMESLEFGNILNKKIKDFESNKLQFLD